ncbi:MAG: transcriptional repressor [Nitrospirae bacterium]|nr:transcriptional repressor [Nitrospirota bacterium]
MIGYRELRLKLTPQRIAILDYLKDNIEHPSADDIYKAVSLKYPTMSFATVYNTLEALRKKGGVTELTIDATKKRFDPNTKPHHHLICIECRRIVDIDVTYDLTLSGEKKSGFDIVGNHIEFYGICPECKDHHHNPKKEN